MYVGNKLKLSGMVRTKEDTVTVTNARDLANDSYSSLYAQGLP